MDKNLYSNSNQSLETQQNQVNSTQVNSQASPNAFVSTVNSYLAEIQRLTAEVNELKAKLIEKENLLVKFNENKEYYLSVLKKSIGLSGSSGSSGPGGIVL